MEGVEVMEMSAHGDSLRAQYDALEAEVALLEDAIEAAPSEEAAEEHRRVMGSAERRMEKLAYELTQIEE